MAPDPRRRYDPLPPIPSYDEAVGGGSRSASDGEWQRRQDPLHSPIDIDDHPNDETEDQFLLNSRLPHTTTSSRSRHSTGYAQPTVETDDEDSSWEDELDNELEEAANIRREMQEMEIIDMEHEEHSRNLSSIWGKRIGFSLSLPQFRWRWQWRLPRWRIRLGEDRGGGSSSGPGGDGASGTGEEPPRRRCPWPKMSGTAVLLVVGRVLAIFLVLGFLYMLFMSDLFTNMAHRMSGQMFDPESVRIHVQSMVDPRHIRENIKRLSSYAHMAGTEGDYALASDMRNSFVKYGLDNVAVDEYYAYLNYPKKDGRAVEILGPDSVPVWSAQIEEADAGEEFGHETYVFHGHSKSGDVRGPLIYANYGTREDFKRLYDSGIDTRGAIALVRQGGPQPSQGLKVKAAELAGFAGCIIYTDPNDNGFVKGTTAPSGRFMPADGVERGSVSLSNWVMGDVLTPGWDSNKGMPRIKPERSLATVNIPSIPLAWRDAQVLLQRLRGFGQPCPPEWVGGVPDVNEWWSGDGSSPLVRLKNEQDEVERQPIWNVYGKIAGVEQSSKTVIIGNRRDSFAFGATSPHSGTAVMLEMVRIYGDLVARGWRPLRSIEFMSWDGGAYNRIGSTEFVEKNSDSLRADALAYINLDDAVAGTDFYAAGSPVFKGLLLQVMNRVSDPLFNTSIRDLWDRRGGEIDGLLDADSDYAPFLNIAGTSSINLHFRGDPYPRDSSYDTAWFVESVGDPSFDYHTMLGQVLALMIVELADRPVMPFDMVAYAESLQRWVEELSRWTENKGANVDGGPRFDLTVLHDATNRILMAVRGFITWEVQWEQSVLAAGGWEPGGLGAQRGDYNRRMARFETDLLDLTDGGGIVNRTQFKHVVYGPTQWPVIGPNGVASIAFFPGIRDLVDAGDWAAANQTVERIARIMNQAAENLFA